MSKDTFPQAKHDFAKTNGGSHGFATTGPSLTRQEFAEECDINTLMARYDTAVIGGPGNLGPQEPLYNDWTTTPSTLMEYMETMAQAETAFMSLPAVVRKEFDNSPVEFVAFASDPENLEQMRTWGLAPPAKPQDEPAPVVPVPAPSSAPPASSPAGGASTHGST